MLVAQFSPEALGQVVRDLRDRQGTTQERLGKAAGYGKGAGVSISRLESGLVLPSAERFAGIARALGLTPEELETRASTRTAHDVAAASASARGTAGDGVGSAHAPKALKDRERRIEQEIAERTRVVTELSESFNLQHDRARDAFFLRFVEIAARVSGVRSPAPAPLQAADDPDAVASYRLRSNANSVMGFLAAGGAGAGGETGGSAAGSEEVYEKLVAVVFSGGPVSTGRANPAASGAAATDATLAMRGGGTLVAGGAGVALLFGLVGGAALALVWMAKRTRKRQQERAAQLAAAEAELAATKPGVEALQDLLPRASASLDYIATHAGHALNRWADQLGPGSTTWEALGPPGQQHFEDFVEIAAAQVAIVTINVQGLLTTRGRDQAELIELADKVLIRAQDAVEARV